MSYTPDEEDPETTRGPSPVTGSLRALLGCLVAIYLALVLLLLVGLWRLTDVLLNVLVLTLMSPTLVL